MGNVPTFPINCQTNCHKCTIRGSQRDGAKLRAAFHYKGPRAFIYHSNITAKLVPVIHTPRRLLFVRHLNYYINVNYTRYFSTILGDFTRDDRKSRCCTSATWKLWKINSTRANEVLPLRKSEYPWNIWNSLILRPSSVVKMEATKWPSAIGRSVEKRNDSCKYKGSACRLNLSKKCHAVAVRYRCDQIRLLATFNPWFAWKYAIRGNGG